ncbi:MAG: endonuclease/exonuclease/phosphatase family protein [Anaeromyxobacter sp.]
MSSHSTRAAVLALLLTALSSCAPAPGAASPAGAGRAVRVATWNLHDLFDAQDDPATLDEVPAEAEVEARLAGAAAVLRAVAADVVVVQEVEDRALLARLGAAAGYPEVRLVEGNDPRGIDVGALSRLPVAGYRTHRDERGEDGRLLWPRDCVELAVEVGAARLVVVASHLSSALSDDGTRRTAQAARLRAIADAARAAGAQVVAGGDLNDQPTSAPLAPLLGDGAWRDAPALLARSAWTWGSGGRREVLDHLAVPRADEGSVLASAIVDGAEVAAASDHRPVVLDLWVEGAALPAGEARSEIRGGGHMPDDPTLDPTPGLAGGPGPTPPGVDDNTPHAVPPEPAPEPRQVQEGAREGVTGVPRHAPSAERQEQAGEIAERSAGTRGAEVEQDQRREATREEPGERG